MEYYSDFETGIGFVVFYLIYMLVMFGLSVACYVLRSLGCYTIAKRRGIKKPWLSWIPVADTWLLGSISDQYQYVVKGRVKSKRKVMLVLSIIQAVLYVAVIVGYVVVIVNMVTGFVGNVGEDELFMGILRPVMGILGICIPLLGVAIALLVFRYMALYDLYRSCCPANDVLFLVLSIFFGVTEPFFIFFNRKKDDGMPPRKPEPQAYIPQYQPPQGPEIL
ncbi:MAG: hypothetical protein J6J18_01405 [Oscillospiraceae bacterium]|nr:hypothetical protein [Oscillospiraceae bacterium]